MNSIDFLEKIRLVIHEASYTTVGKEWEKVVAVYPYYRIYLVKGGRAEIKLKNKTLVLESGYLYFLPAYQVSSSCLEKSLSHYYIHFLAHSDFAACDPIGFFNFYNKIPYRKELEAIFHIIMENRQQRNEFEKISLKAATQLLLVSFLCQNSFHLPEDNRMTVIVQYINEHLCDEILVSKLADIAGYNRSYFCTLFKKVFKVSPQEYILQQKIKKAQDMLLDSSLSITDISNQLNFQSSSYFTRIFKSKTQLSPSNYRKQLQIVST